MKAVRQNYRILIVSALQEVMTGVSRNRSTYETGVVSVNFKPGTLGLVATVFDSKGETVGTWNIRVGTK
jgi:hypothetical protein